jgi:hypothetical protein
MANGEGLALRANSKKLVSGFKLRVSGMKDKFL